MEEKTKVVELDLTNARDKALLSLFENRHLLDGDDLSDLRIIRTKLNAVAKEEESNNRFHDKTLEIAYNSYINSLTKKIELNKLQKLIHSYFGNKDLKRSMFSAEELLGMISNDKNSLNNTCDSFSEIIDSLEDHLGQ